MTMFTLLPDGVTVSDSSLDLMFSDAREMKTTDAFGRPCNLLLAHQAEAFARAFAARYRDYGDGCGMSGHWYAEAAKFYGKYAAEMQDNAKHMWKQKPRD